MVEILKRYHLNETEDSRRKCPISTLSFWWGKRFVGSPVQCFFELGRSTRFTLLVISLISSLLYSFGSRPSADKDLGCIAYQTNNSRFTLVWCDVRHATRCPSGVPGCTTSAASLRGLIEPAITRWTLRSFNQSHLWTPLSVLLLFINFILNSYLLEDFVFIWPWAHVFNFLF